MRAILLESTLTSVRYIEATFSSPLVRAAIATRLVHTETLVAIGCKYSFSPLI
ncbi:hypothetical protein ES703_06926 [subsurface metagenome]